MAKNDSFICLLQKKTLLLQTFLKGALFLKYPWQKYIFIHIYKRNVCTRKKNWNQWMMHN